MKAGRRRSPNGPAPACGTDDTCAPFTRPGPSLYEALAEHGLEVYAASFEREGIDAELAQTMTTPDLRALLPTAPYGDCLRMRALFQEAFRRRPSIPDSPGWRVPAMMLANGQISGSLMEQYARWCDNIMILASLLLSLAVGSWLEPPSECSDGSPCESSLMLDYTVWSLAMGSLFLAAFTAFMGSAFFPQLLRDEDAPLFVLHNWLLFSLPTFLCTIGIASLCLGLGTRALITLDDTKGTLGAAAMGACLLAIFGFFYRVLVQTTGTRVAELPIVQLSFWGFPIGRCEELQQRDVELRSGQAGPWS